LPFFLRQRPRPLFSHVINPLHAPDSSDLKRAQPITFDTMRMAQEFAESQGISVEQLAVFFPEDRTAVPARMKHCKPLERSCMDFAEFSQPRKLPLFGDIFDRALEAAQADYIVYTNVDIALMPHFYLTARALVADGPDAVYVFRRTLSDHYQSLEEIPLMFADMGEDHPGTDCFIIKRELVERFVLEKSVIGARFSAFALDINLRTLGEKIDWHRRLHLTFHIGDPRPWMTQNEYSRFNLRESEKVLENIRSSGGYFNEDMYAFFLEDLERKRVWIKAEPGGPGDA
jgi:hypothetical protein